MKIEITYNSYTYNVQVKSDDKSYNDENTGSQCKRIIKDSENKRIEVWFESFLEMFGEDFNCPDLDIDFTSTLYEINIVEEVIAKVAKKNNWKISFNSVATNSKNVLGELNGLIKTMIESKEESLYKQFEENHVLLKVEEIDKREVSVVVIAPMSAGKSTLINALIGKDLLPSQNKATTATICKIKDIDGKEGFDAVIKNGKGEELARKENIDTSFIEDYNNKGNTEDIEIFIEGDIKNIDSSDLKLVLVDTPGPNNSQNIRHKEVTLNYIKDKNNNPLILYVLNAAQLETNDDKSVLTEISEFIKQNGSKAKERIIFVLNRIDEFKKSDGNLDNIINECEEYLNDLGITNSKIFPISAQLAKLTLINKSGLLDDEDDREQLEFLAKKMIRKDTIQFSPISQTQKDFLYEESKNDTYKASLHYSGLTALQIYINDYVNNTHKIEVANGLINTLKPVLENVIIEHQKVYNSSQEEIEKCCEDLEKIAPFLSEEYQESKKKLSDRINGISDNNQVLNGLNQKVNKHFNDISFKLSSEKVKKQQAKILLDDAKKIADDLGSVLSSTIESEYNKDVEDVKTEIQSMIEASFKQLVTNAKLSDQNTHMLKNHIQININSTVDKTVYRQKEIIDQKEESDSRWYNPFSWWSKRTVATYGDVEYVDLLKIYNSDFSPLRNDIIKKLVNVISTFKESVKKMKTEGISKIEEIEENLKEKINQEKTVRTQIELSESVKIDKEKELEKMESYQKTLETIIN